MARYYAEIQGNRGKASRMGTASSGIWGHIRGWNIGVEVDCHPDPTSPEYDVCDVYETGGSTRNWAKKKDSHNTRMKRKLK